MNPLSVAHALGHMNLDMTERVDEHLTFRDDYQTLIEALRGSDGGLMGRYRARRVVISNRQDAGEIVSPASPRESVDGRCLTW